MVKMNKYVEKLQQDIKPVDLLTNYHVYALWKDGVIVYIGQSTQLYSRIKVHSKTKDFDSFSYFECDSKSEMDLLESNLIIELEPEYNKTVTNGYESIPRFRERIRSISDRYRYNSDYYVPRIKKKLKENGFELIHFKGTTSIAVQDVPSALKCMVGNIEDWEG